MQGFIKKIIPAFICAVIFVTIIMTCCILKYAGRSPNSSKDVQNTADSPNSAERSTAAGELRGVWIPYFTLENGSEHVSEREFKSRFDSIVAVSKAHGINALFVHVRSHCDAAYPSDIFPYSEMFLNGGEPPKYDPLEYMIETAHNAGLELHAWINPYRINDESTAIPYNSPCKKWEGTNNVVIYDGGVYLDPSSEKAQAMIIDGAKELAARYNVDGIHLDDYFYPFTEPGIDSNAYTKYVRSVPDDEAPLTLREWRCENVNSLVSGIYRAVNEIDSDIVFGISPQGNIENDLAMGADVEKWCSERYIDYIAPQLYYNSQNAVCPFESTFDRWQAIAAKSGVRFYAGLALYKAGSDEDGGTWLSSKNIIAAQAEYCRSRNADGFILYSYDYLESPQTSEEMENLDRAFIQ